MHSPLALSVLSLLLPLTLSHPFSPRATCTDPSGAQTDEWFITPSQGNACNSNLPNYRPNPGSASAGASCQPLYNLQADPNGATTFTSASVAIPCGGWNVTLYSTTDCSDQGVAVTGVNSVPACAQAVDGAPFTYFAVVAA